MMDAASTFCNASEVSEPHYHSTNITGWHSSKRTMEPIGLFDTDEGITIFESYRLVFAMACFALWVFGWYKNKDIGNVFGYKGDDCFLKFVRKLNICCWWLQCPAVWYSLTYPNQWIDFITLFTCITFGGWFGCEFFFKGVLGYIINFILEASHHCGVALCILFESDENKRLYRFIFVWGWAAHTLEQIRHHFGRRENIRLSMDFIYEGYWKLGPYLYGFWYITKFMESDEMYLSPSVIALWFGRWVMPWNWLERSQFDGWRSESYNTILFLLLVLIFLRDSR